jgi:hypothetical protein
MRRLICSALLVASLLACTSPQQSNGGGAGAGSTPAPTTDSSGPGRGDY